MDNARESSKELELNILVEQLLGCENRALGKTKCAPSCVSMDSRLERGGWGLESKCPNFWSTAPNSTICCFSYRASVTCDEWAQQRNLSPLSIGKKIICVNLTSGAFSLAELKQRYYLYKHPPPPPIPHLLLPQTSIYWNLLRHPRELL